MNVRELIGRLQQVNQEYTVLVVTSGGTILDDIDPELLEVPSGMSIAICPLRQDPAVGEQRH